MINKELFSNPPIKYAPLKMHHIFGEDIRAELSGILKLGYRGVVTNIPRENGFTGSESNIKKYRNIISEINAMGIGYWLYDEAGYPSGKAGGIAVLGHPELRSMGIFMHKEIALSSRQVSYTLPEDARKIVYAVKYPASSQGESIFADLSHPTPLEFSDTELNCSLSDNEVLYVFAIKFAHDGTHAMYNASGDVPLINIMDKQAVKRFIEVAYKPLASAEGALNGAGAVFTDEPSLLSTYSHGGQIYPFALAPYSPDLFEEYERAFGERLEPKLPYIFEGGKEAYSTRFNFYTLCGELIANAYTSQLNSFCIENGTKLSGHYLGEENLNAHVQFYGDYSKVLSASGYPGFDILPCYPEIYRFLDAKFPEMISRKRGYCGLMVELCPYDGYQGFIKAPYENTACTVALCFMHGARVCCSYFGIKKDYDEALIAKGLPVDENGEVNQEPLMQAFNEYTSRLSYTLNGATPETDVFVYYPIEDVKARHTPSYSKETRDNGQSARESVKELSDNILDGGFNFLFADADDLILSAKSLPEGGNPEISGNELRYLIIPETVAIRQDALEAVEALASVGVKVIFHKKRPDLALSCTECRPANHTYPSEILTSFEILDLLRSRGGVFSEKTEERIIRASFRSENGRFYMLTNMSRTEGKITWNSESEGEILDPASGKSTKIKPGEIIRINPTSALFVF